MNILVNPRIFESFDNPRIAVTVVRDINNQAVMTDFMPGAKALMQDLESRYKNEVISQLPHIAAWREAYRTFGVKAKDYPSSIEALYKRIAKGVDVMGINPLVDIYNFISLKYMIPAGGEDLDALSGDLQLTYATDDEIPVTVIGKQEAQAPPAGEVIYKDDLGTICRRWNWREVARVVLAENTTQAILVLEVINPMTDELLHAAQQELGELVQTYCGGSVQHMLLHKNQPKITLS